ncbi:MAG TPA: cytochrome c oxidase assembly protein [Caulobacterales bacterium]|nr:cytochrome c oxidase assembly protein [Caulobacterales bacterium]
MSGLAPDKKRRAAFTAGIVGAVVLGMTALAFAAVPLYRAFCQATGYGGTTRVASAASHRVLERTVEVTFDTNVANGMPIEFSAKQRHQTLRLGETGLAFFHVRNVSSRPVTAVATYNVAPHKIGIYFQKLECFCFQPRVLQPGESADLPVVYFVDPELASNPETSEVRQIVLSYTYFESADAAAAALAQAETAQTP